MERYDIGKFLLGLGSSVIGIKIIILWYFMFSPGGIGLLLIGIYLMSTSKETWKESVKNILPFRPGNLFRFPRLPYFQTGIMVLLLLGSMFMILPSSYGGFILILFGLAISQSILTIFKKNIKDESKILMVFEFQLFIFFSTFIYVNFERFYFLSRGSGYIQSFFLFIAWFLQFLYMYFKFLK